MKLHLFHHYRLVAIEHFTDVSYSKVGVSMTSKLLRCDCGKHKTEDLYGTWSIEQLEGRRERVA